MGVAHGQPARRLARPDSDEAASVVQDEEDAQLLGPGDVLGLAGYLRPHGVSGLEKDDRVRVRGQQRDGDDPPLLAIEEVGAIRPQIQLA